MPMQLAKIEQFNIDPDPNNTIEPIRVDPSKSTLVVFESGSFRDEIRKSRSLLTLRKYCYIIYQDKGYRFSVDTFIVIALSFLTSTGEKVQRGEDKTAHELSIYLEEDGQVFPIIPNPLIVRNPL